MKHYDTITDLALDCLLKTRFQGEDELWERFEAKCRKHDALAIPGQLKNALNTLKGQGKLEYVKGKGVRRV